MSLRYCHTRTTLPQQNSIGRPAYDLAICSRTEAAQCQRAADIFCQLPKWMAAHLSLWHVPLGLLIDSDCHYELRFLGAPWKYPQVTAIKSLRRVLSASVNSCFCVVFTRYINKQSPIMLGLPVRLGAGETNKCFMSEKVIVRLVSSLASRWQLKDFTSF